MIDDDIWNGVLEPYEKDPSRAFILAQILFSLKQTLDDPKGKASVAHALDLAIERLYPYTEHHKAGLKLFALALSGDLKPEHDPRNSLSNCDIS